MSESFAFHIVPSGTLFAEYSPAFVLMDLGTPHLHSLTSRTPAQN
jgi:hypothetical protein